MADATGACIHWPLCPICGPRPSTPKIDAVRVARSGVGEYFVQVADAGSGYDDQTGFDEGDLIWRAQDVDDDDPPLDLLAEPFSYARAMARARDLATTPDLGVNVVFMGIVNLYQDPHDHPDCDYCEPGLTAMTARAIAVLNEDAGQSFNVNAQQSTGARARNLVRGHVVEGAQGGASDSMALVTIFLEPLGGCAPPWCIWDHPGLEIALAKLLPADLYVEIINAAVAYVCPS